MSARAVLALLLALAGLLGSGAARADTVCSVSVAGPLAFGSIGNAAALPTNTMTTLTINCTSTGLSVLGGAAVRLCLGLGAGSTGSTLAPLRSMTNATADPMNFQLYTNATRTTPWGLVPAASPAALSVDLVYAVPLIGGSGSTTVTVYGQVPALQTLSFGAYSSTFATTGTSLEFAYNQTLIGGATLPPLCTSTAGVTGHVVLPNPLSLTTTANVLPQCSATVATDMDFGTRVGSITSAIDQTSTITTTCLKRTPFNVALDDGLYAGIGGSGRKMRHATNAAFTIPYELYRDSGRTLRWGSTLNVDTLAQTGTGSAQPITVYGRAPATVGAVAEGSYNDQIKVTITF